MSDTKYETNPRSCEYLASFGIDPNRIASEPVWDATGYVSFQGEGIGDRRNPLRLPWPDGFDYEKLVEHFAADEPTRRQLR